MDEGISGGLVALICPDCRSERPDWSSGLERCPRCGSTRLSLTLGEVVCRECGSFVVAADPDL